MVSFGTTTVPISSFSASKSPGFAVQNAIDYNDEAHLGIWTQTGDIGDTDESDPDGKARLAHDWIFHRETFPASDQTDWYIVFYTDPSALLDWIHISDLTFPGADATVDIDMYLWDSDINAWSLQESWSEGFNRAGRFSLMLSNRYLNTERVRLRFSTAGSAFRPRLTELMFLEFFQLEFPEHIGSSSDLDLDIQGVAVTTGGGHWTPVETSEPQRVVTIVYKPVVGSDDKTNLELFFSRVGMFPFVFVDDPTITDHQVNIMRLDPFFSPFPLTLPKLYSGRITMAEVAPMLATEISNL